MLTIRYPLMEVFPITQDFSPQHPALDWGAPMRSQVLAAAAGKVEAVRFQSAGYGLYVILKHAEDATTLYAHLDEVYVSVGDSVEEGTPIAASGSSGNSTGPHLHFELRLDGKKAINPIPYLEALQPESHSPTFMSQPAVGKYLAGDKVILKEEYNYVNLRPLPAYGMGVADIGDYCGGAVVEVLEQQGEMIAIKVWIHGGYVRKVTED
ncbi:MAG: M23 family metallopeptidase [Anaerolineales bacterium]